MPFHILFPAHSFGSTLSSCILLHLNLHPLACVLLTLVSSPFSTPRCELASLLTVALHSNLSYLTEVMEALLRDLIQQTSSTQSKLLLRRTETIVEKLVTNWMSVCLYGFLRVGCSCVSVFAVL